MFSKTLYTLFKNLAILFIVVCIVIFFFSYSSRDYKICMKIGIAGVIMWIISLFFYFRIPGDVERGSFKGADSILQYLIVIVVILIMLAIALPSYMGSNVRKYVLQTKDDLRGIKSALNDYAKDHDSFPTEGLSILTTPTPYLEKLNIDPFSRSKDQGYRYYSDGENWILWALGPDRDYDIEPESMTNPKTDLRLYFMQNSYDPTNGSESNGDIWFSSFD